MTQTEFFQARQKALLLLAAEYAKHELGGVGRAAPRHHGQDQAGEKGVIEIGDAAPTQPLRFLREGLFSSTHVLSRVSLVICDETISTVIASASEAIHCREQSWIASSLTLLAMTADYTRKCLLSFSPCAW